MEAEQGANQSFHLSLEDRGSQLTLPAVTSVFPVAAPRPIPLPFTLLLSLLTFIPFPPFTFTYPTVFLGASQMVLVIKNLPANVGGARDADSIPGSERSPGVRNGTPLQYSCLENFLGRGPW